MKMRNGFGIILLIINQGFNILSNREAIIKAICDLEIELYNDYVESDSYTEDVVWSEFEERSAEEILGGS